MTCANCQDPRWMRHLAHKRSREKRSTEKIISKVWRFAFLHRDTAGNGAYFIHREDGSSIYLRNAGNKLVIFHSVKNPQDY